MSDRFRSAVKKMWNRAEEQRWVYGTLGRRNTDNSYTFVVPGRPTFVYVTIRQANGAQSVVPARNDANVPHQPNLGVKMRQINGPYVIEGHSGRQDISTAPVPPVYGITPHATSHKNGGSDEIASAVAGANLIPKAEADGKLAAGWIDLTDYAEELQDAVDTMLVAGTNITLTYNDTTGELEIAATGGGAVDSVNGQTGVVDLDADNIDETASRIWFTTAEETKLAGIETAADVTDAGNVGSSIHGATAKTTPVDADTMPLIDSAASNVLKKVTWANIKVVLKAYFDTLYATTTGWIKADGTVPLTADWDIGEDRAVLAENLRARDVEGLSVYDDGGNLGFQVQDGGFVAFGVVTASGKLHIYDTANLTAYLQSNGGRANLFVVSQATNKFARLGFIQGGIAGATRFEIGLSEDSSGNFVIGGDSMTDKWVVLSSTGGITLKRNAAGALISFANAYSITEGSNTFNTGFFRGSSDNAVVLTIVRGTAIEALMGAGVNGDSFRRFLILADGTLQWGSGSATRDTNLYRSSADHLKTDDALLVIAGSGDEAEVGGMLYVNSTETGNVSGGEDTLYSYTLPANTLLADGQSITVEVGGIVDGFGDRTARLYFGGTLIGEASDGAGSTLAFAIRATIIRTGATAQKSICYEYINRAANIARTVLSKTLSSSQVISVTGESSASITGAVKVDYVKIGWDNNNT